MLGILFFLCLWFPLTYLGVSFTYQLIIPILVYQLMKLIMKYGFDIEMFDALELTMMINDKNRCHLTSSLVIDELIGEDFIERTKKNLFCHKFYERLKYKFQSNFMSYFWIRDKNFNVNNHFTILGNGEISSYDDLMEFTGKHISEIPFDGDKPKWMFYIVPKFLGSQSIIILKIHHNYGDAVAFLSFYMNIFQCKDFKFVNFRKPSAIQYAIAIAVSALHLPLLLIKDLFRKNSLTPFHKGKHLSGKKKYYSSEPFDINSIKEKAKSVGGTVNDAILAELMKTIKIYSLRVHNQELEEINMIVSATLRPFPGPGKQCKLNNEVMPFVVDIPLRSNGSIDERVRFYNRHLMKYKMSMYNLINRYIVDIIMLYLPNALSNILINWIGSKSCCVYSSVPGPLEQVKFFDKKVNRMYAAVNLPFDCESTFVAFSYNQKIMLMMIVDDSVEFNPKAFVEEWKENLVKDFEISLK